MIRPHINPRYNVLTLINLLSTAMHADINTEEWERYFAIDAKELEDIQALFQKINDWYSIDNAKGITLDYKGNDLGVLRNGDDDDIYRFRIKSKRWIRLSDGTCNAIYRMVSGALGIEPSDFYVHENDLPNQIVIDDIPAEKIDRNEKIKWLVEQAENAVAFGIKIAEIDFQSNNFNNYNIFTGCEFETEITNVCKPISSVFNHIETYVASTFIYENSITNVTKINNKINNFNNFNVKTGYQNMSELTNVAKNIKERD